MIINNLLNSVLMIHDLGEDGYAIQANAKNFDLARVFTPEQIEYSVGLRTAKANGWIDIVGEKSVNYLKDNDITEDVRVITEATISKAMRRNKIVEQLNEAPQVIIDKPLVDKKIEEVIVEPQMKLEIDTKIEETEKPEINEQKTETKEVEKLKINEQEIKTEEKEEIKVDVIKKTEEKKLENLSWNELRGVAKEKGINLRQKRAEILRQLKGEVA